MVHWNRYEMEKYRPEAMVNHHVDKVRQFAMYRGEQGANEWDDADKRLSEWRTAFTGETIRR
ncbi:MAG TPA: hypothetical protein VH765_11745 [Xanthobacteraceae bacterium]